MTSSCRDSQGSITLEFAVGTNIEDAMMRVNTRLQQVREYPIEVTEPSIASQVLRLYEALDEYEGTLNVFSPPPISSSMSAAP